MIYEQDSRFNYYYFQFIAAGHFRQEATIGKKEGTKGGGGGAADDTDKHPSTINLLCGMRGVELLWVQLL